MLISSWIAYYFNITDFFVIIAITLDNVAICSEAVICSDSVSDVN